MSLRIGRLTTKTRKTRDLTVVNRTIVALLVLSPAMLFWSSNASLAQVGSSRVLNNPAF